MEERILRPKRGTKSSAEEQEIVLKNGEVFFEYPETGIGTDSGKVKMGDGETEYANLPYFIGEAGESLGTIKSGGDLTIVNGVATVNDDSHNHTIDNIDDLQDELNSKVPSTRKINGKVLSDDVSLSASDVGADASGSADTALSESNKYTDNKIASEVTNRNSAISNSISNHNTSTSAHNDIRILITEITTKLNNFLDVDDTTTDQLSEVITLINNNKGTLESFTTSKINVSDIVDNLTTANNKKVLSANAGVIIKELIDDLQSELDSHGHEISEVNGLQTALNNKANASHGTHVTYGTNTPKVNGTASAGTSANVSREDHVHPVDTSRASASDLSSHTGDTTKHITSTERTNWDSAKTHADSSHAPTNAERNIVVGIQKNGTDLTPDSNRKVNITVPTKVGELTNDKGYLTSHQDISGKLDKTGDASNVTNTFSSASSRSNLTTGEKLSVSLGKIAKWFADLKAVAFTGNYADLSNKPTVLTGGSQTTTSAADGGSNVYTFTKSDGTTSTLTIKNGSKGSTGVTGKGIKSVAQTTTSAADGGTNVMTITLTDDTTSTFNVKNGSKGSQGNTGTRGSLWYSGTGITGTSTTATIFSNSGVSSALVNDYYLNPSTGYVYKCTTAGNASTAKWAYVGSIKGATGANGTNATTTAEATTSAKGLMSANDKTKLDNTNEAYGTCSTAAGTAAKVITISGNTKWALKAGSRITVKFSATNTAQNPTLNVNSTGAKSIWYNTALITTSNLGYAGTANRPMDFVYDGTQYVFMGWSLDNNTTYSPQSLGSGYGTCATAAATTAKVVTLSGYSLVTNGFVAVKFTYDVPASATMNINSKGAKAMYYKGSAITAGVIKAGDLATFIYNGSQYHLIGIDRTVSGSLGAPVYYQSSEPTANDTAIWIA